MIFKKDIMIIKVVRSFLTWLVFLTTFILLCACEAVSKEPKYPLPNGIPMDDIVFMPDSDPVHLNNNGRTLGFINADGTRAIYFTFQIYGGALSNFGVQLSLQQANYPRWSRSGTTLAFSVSSTPPDIRLIDSRGRMYGQNCDALDQDTTFDPQGNILGEITKDSPVFSEYKNKITPNISLVAQYDLKTCKIIDVFSIPVPQNSPIYNISEAENGLITAEFYDPNEDTFNIILFNLMTQKSTLFPGYYPSLSSDGTLLAYYSPVGNLIVRNIQSGVEKSIINFFAIYNAFDTDYLSMPGWSPDNRWLVYNTPEGKVYKVNIETDEKVYIIDGWAPDWRP